MNYEIRKKARRYFSSLSGYFILALVIGVMLLVGREFLPEQIEKITSIDSAKVLRITKDVFFGLGVISILTGVAGIIAYFFFMPKDNYIDEQLAADMKELREMAYQKLGLDEENLKGKDLFLWSPPQEHIDRISSGASFKKLEYKLGKDGKFRFSKYRMMILIPTNELLGVFVATYDMIRDIIYESETAEYFYEDLVSIHTYDGVDVSLTFTDGSSFKLSIPSNGYTGKLYACENARFIPFDEAVQEVRKLVKTHKETD